MATTQVDVYRDLKFFETLTFEQAEDKYQVNDVEGVVNEYGRLDSDDPQASDVVVTMVAHGDPAPTTYYEGE